MRAPEFAVEATDDTAILSGTLDFDTAPGAHAELSRLIRERPELLIDLTNVARSNSAGLALLVECVAEAGRLGHRVRFEGVPDGLRQLAEVSEVDALIDSGRV